MSSRRPPPTGQPSWTLRLFASAPVRLLLAVVVIVVVMRGVGSHLDVEMQPVPALFATGQTAPIQRPGDPLMVVFESDHLTPEYVSAVERITNLAGAIPGVHEVRSVTNTLVLTRSDTLRPTATPAFGTKSALPLAMTLTERATLAATSRLGSADLISADGRTMAIMADLDSDISPETRAEAARRFNELMTTEVAAAGLPATVHPAGAVYTALAVAESSRSDFRLLVLLASVVPALLLVVALRHRVPAASVLAAGGAVLLVGAGLISTGGAAETNGLAADNPVAVGNAIVDRDLHGHIALEIEFVGSKDDFRQPEVLARVDALASWLRDEYQVNVTGLSSTLRDETAILTGVDVVPPHRESIDDLIDETASFDGGRLLRQLASDDYSQTRLVAYWPDQGNDSLVAMAGRFDRISTAELRGTDVAARLAGRVADVGGAPMSLSQAVAGMGVLALVLAVAASALGAFARHRVAVAEGLARTFDTAFATEGPTSLFGRAKVVIHDLEQQVREYDETDHRPPRAERTRPTSERLEFVDLEDLDEFFDPPE